MKSCVVITAEKIRGSTLYALQGSTMVNFLDKDNENPNNEEYFIFMWGGLNTKTINCTSELVELKVSKTGEPKRTRTGRKCTNASNEKFKKVLHSV